MAATGCAPDPSLTEDREQPAAASTLRRALGAVPATLDPRAAEDNAALTVASDLYEGLTTEAADGSIVPGAAASWTISDGGQTYTFKLRPDLKWSNGDALTAEHFAAALRLTTAPTATAPYAALLADLETIEVVAHDTLRIRLTRPVPYLPALLAQPIAAPLHPGSAPAPAPPGNGPFRFVTQAAGDRIELERNPHFHSAGEVALDRVVHLTIEDLGTELALYRTGELDMTSEVPNAQLATLGERLPGELVVTPYLSTYSYAVNLERLPSAGARRALAMAVDRERITRQVTGAGERPALGWVPEGIPGYSPARFAWTRLPYAESMREARALWDAARAAGDAPARLVLCTDASANHHRTAVALADLWQTTLGVETEIVELEWNVYLDTRRNPGDCDLIRYGWSADFVDPEAFVAVFETGHPQNTLGYSSETYDALLAQSRTTADDRERMELLRQAETRLLEDVPVIPVFFRVSKRLVKPYVTGVGANPLGHVPSRYLHIGRAQEKGREARAARPKWTWRSGGS